MKHIIQYLRQYVGTLDVRIFLLTSLLTALLVFVNYFTDLDGEIRKNNSFFIKLIAWYVVFLIAFVTPYLFTGIVTFSQYLTHKQFIFIALIAPLLFAIKISLPVCFCFDANGDYWNQVFYWPMLLIIMLVCLLVVWLSIGMPKPFFGTSAKNLNWSPYFIMLLIMVPLIALAATQPDFQAAYPKLHSITSIADKSNLNWWHKFLFELSYGSDFITIEVFFRGFLVVAFAKWAGKDAILPMACFYCTIHFGKPIGECISSYFGGIILGIVVYNTKSIWGGLLVHLGIAWLMEVAGYIANG
jgi:hypothetical protein